MASPGPAASWEASLKTGHEDSNLDSSRRIDGESAFSSKYADTFNTIPTKILKGGIPNLTMALKFTCKNEQGRTVKKIGKKRITKRNSREQI